MHFELMLADQCGGGRLLCHLRLCCSIHHHRTWAVPWRQTTSQHSMSLMNKRQVATKPKSEDATGIISFRQRFLSGNFDDFFGVPLFGSSPKTEAKGLQKIGQCVSWGELRPALWVFWIPQGCTKTMLHIIKGIETRHPTGKLSWKWTLYQTLSCTSWVSFQVEKVSNNWTSHSTYLLNLPFPCFIYDDTFIVHWCSMSPLGRMAQTLGRIPGAATEGWVCDHPHHGTLATTHHCAVDFLAHAPCPEWMKSVWPCEDFDS